MGETKAELFAALGDAVLRTPGHLTPAVREAIESRAAGEGDEVPAELTTLVDTVARHAYKTTDSDVDRLRDAGYTEDAVFEAIVAAALGAGRMRLERGIAALRGEA